MIPTQSLVAFLRAEHRHAPSPMEHMFCTHVRNCKQPTCLLPQCLEMRAKLAHLEACQSPTCMSCSSARVSQLTCLGVLPQRVIEGYLQAQSELMQASLAGRKARVSTAEMPTRLAQFNAAQHAVFRYWRRRSSLPPQATGSNHVVGNWLREGGVGEARLGVLREWEDAKRIKLSNV